MGLGRFTQGRLVTLTRAETCSLWRGALLGLDILKSEAERDSPVGPQPLTL